MTNLLKTFAVAGIMTYSLLQVASATAQSESTGQGHVIVTLLPKHDGTLAPQLSPANFNLKINGKPSSVTGWTALKDEQSTVELVVMIDDGARSSLANQYDSIATFLKGLPPNVRASLAYMNNGRAELTVPFTTNHAQVAQQLRLPMHSGSTGPYFSLSELAKHWPSSDTATRREVLLISDGVDPFYPRLDLDDPYVQEAIDDAVRANIVVYSIYWQDARMIDRSLYMSTSGQTRLAQVSDATGGKSFWIGMGNPVSIDSYLDEINRRLANQYELSFTANLHGKPEIMDVKLKLSAPGMDVSTPQKALVSRTAPAGAQH